jgi:hypothetical protein
MFKAKEVLNKHLECHVSPLLTERGFLQEGYTWNRACEGFLQVASLRMNRFNTPSEISFTLNLGIYQEDCSALLLGFHPRRTPEASDQAHLVKEFECALRISIGGLAKAQEDLWWWVSEDRDPPASLADFQLHLENHALPWVDRVTTPEDVLAEAQRLGQMDRTAVLSHHFGRPENEVQAHLDAVFSEPDHFSHLGLERLRNWAGDLGYRAN